MSKYKIESSVNQNIKQISCYSNANYNKKCFKFLSRNNVRIKFYELSIFTKYLVFSFCISNVYQRRLHICIYVILFTVQSI